MKKLLYTLAAVLVPSLAMAQTYTENFVKSTTYQVETTTGSVAPDEKIETITYFDGLGRPMQSIAKQAGGNRQDIITPVVYDDFGRQVKDYLPYADPNQTSGANLNYREQDPSFFTAINTRYLAKFPGDLNTGLPNPFSEKRLEASPLNRVLEQGAPGTAWALNETVDTDPNNDDSDHTIKFGYGTNTVSDHVRRFSVSFQNGDTKIPQLVEDPEMVYDPSELYKTVTKDENWQPNQTYPKDHTTEEYTDKQGRVVLKRTFDSKRWLDTYYVYDDYGNLTYVVPPKVMTYSSILQPYIEQEFSYDWEMGDVFVNDSGGWGALTLTELDGKLDIYWYFGNNYTTPVFKNLVVPLNFTPTLPNMAIGTINGSSGVAASVFIQDGNLHIQSTGNPASNADLEKYILLDLMDYQANYTPSVIDNTVLDGLCYQYRYDERNRLIEKKIPGKEDWEYIVYDKLDRPVLVQDSNQRTVNNTSLTTNQWLFTKYDAFGRVIYTGIFDSNDSRETLQNLFNGKNETQNYETRAVGIGYLGSYYTNDDFPNSGIELLTINYYDDYTFYGSSLPLYSGGQNIINHDNNAKSKTKGLATGSKVKVLETSNWITSVTGYDTKGRAIYVKSVNDYLVTTDIVENTLDFVGKVNKTETSHTKSGNTVTTVDDFTYDHMGRLVSQKQKINNLAEELIVLNKYDELGQLESKKVGGDVATSIGSSAGLQTVDYSYNIRGWLKRINDPATLGNRLFTFKLNYNTPGHGATPLYNGNISETEWRTANTDDSSLKWYKYRYDALSRLVEARDNAYRYSVIGNYSNGRNPYSITYDRNGNIKALGRAGFNEEYGTFGVGIDNLAYTYGDNSNRLLKVTDMASAFNNGRDYGFRDGNTNGDDYGYDANGNMLSDANKGITSIAYNHLNLPTLITFNDGSSAIKNISYIYDATGTKLRKSVYQRSGSSSGNTMTTYANGYVYRETQTCSGVNTDHPTCLSLGAVMQFFNHPEGYVDAVNGYKYVYQYKDHLGNVRLTYSDADLNGSINPSTEILQERNFYPFGMEHRGYNNVIVGTENNHKTFQDQEFTEDLGLNMHEFKYRFYDPAIGRFSSVDPLAESFYHNGTYNFSENRVIDGIELEGLEYVSRRHVIDGNGDWTTTDTNYYQMSEDEINDAGGTYQSSTNAASYGPEGKGVKHTYVDADGNELGTRWDFRDDSTRHGLYSGAGSITDAAGDYDFSFQPVDIADAIAKEHDMNYANAQQVEDRFGFVEDTRTLGADNIMVGKVNRALLGNFSASSLGVEQPFRSGTSLEMTAALGGQSAFIGMLGNYKQWKSNTLKSFGFSPDKPQDIARISIMKDNNYSSYSRSQGNVRATIIRTAEEMRRSGQ